MLMQTLQRLFKRDLLKLRNEVESYISEERIWYVEKSISNSAGNLCLHLVGNLNTYIGSVIAKTNYIRNREQEFSLRYVPKQELLQMIDDTIEVVQDALKLVTEEDLTQEYPILVFTEKTTTEFMLVHLATHLSYHLGQINYHRRLLDEMRDVSAA